MEIVMLKRDNLSLGILLGILAPVLGLVIYYFVTFYPVKMGFIEYLGFLKQNKSLLTVVSSISLFENVVLFTIYINTHKDKTAKGIFVATVIYAIAVLVIKLIS